MALSYVEHHRLSPGGYCVNVCLTDPKTPCEDPMTADFKLHNSFAFWIHRLNSLLQEQFNQQLKAYEITWPQWMLLNVLSDLDINTPAAIAGQLGIDRSGVTRLLDRLEAKDFVEREHGLEQPQELGLPEGAVFVGEPAKGLVDVVVGRPRARR
ncbi:MAG: MarR family transcriptional regulator, partial [Pseudomonadota bacterium]